MRPLFFFLLFSMLPLSGMAQNIVYNGSFEEFPEICCIVADGQLCPDNWSASEGSPDHYRDCADGSHSIPQNILGHQFAHNGNAYAGLVTISLPTYVNTREYLVQTMKYELSAGEEYYFECWVSQADHYRRVCHNIGITFTEFQQQLGCVVDCPIYLENDSSNPLDDKEIWTKVSGTFIANGGERKIHIGNFRPDSLSEMEWVTGTTDTAEWWDRAYYYIDDVWLSHIDSVDYLNVSSHENQRGFSVYPNPTNSSIRISTSEPENPVSVQVRTPAGQVIRQESFRQELDVSELPRGVYLLQLIFEDRSTAMQRFVKI